MVPSAFIVIEPAAGVGAAPGVSVTLPPAPTVAEPPLRVSLTRTLGSVTPEAPFTGPKPSSTASITAAPTVTVTVAVSQLVGFRTSQISYVTV